MPIKDINVKSSMFNHLDIFGVSFNFLVEGQNTKKTTTGASLTILYGIIFIALFFGFGIDLYQRKRPKVSFSTYIGEYKAISLSNKNFTYAYRVEDNVGKFVTDESKIYHKVHYYRFTLIDGEWINDFEHILPNKRCQELPFTKEKEKYYNLSLRDWYCIDFDNITLGGNWDGNFLYGFQINTNQCTNSTSRNNCSSQEVIKESFQSNLTSSNYFYSDMSLEVIASMDDFENPIKTNLLNRYDTLNLALTKRKVQTYKATEMINDVGWFFSDVDYISLVSSDTLITDFSFKETWSQDIVYSQFLYFGRKTEIFNRSYTKIQEIFAAIGGFSKFFYFCISLLYYFTMKVYRNLFLINNFIFENDEEVIINQNKLVTNSNSDGLRIGSGYNITLNQNSSQNNLINDNTKIDNYINNNIYPQTSKNNIILENKSKSNDSNDNAPQNVFSNFSNLEGNKTNPITNIILSHQINLPNSGSENKNFQNIPTTNLVSYKRKKPITDIDNITFYNFIRSRVFCRKQNSHNNLIKEKLKSYLKYEKYFLKKMDILSYFELHNQFKQFLKLFLEKEDRRLLKSIPAKLNKIKSVINNENKQDIVTNNQKISLTT